MTNKVHDLIDGYDCGCKTCYENRSLNVQLHTLHRTTHSPKVETPVTHGWMPRTNPLPPPRTYETKPQRLVTSFTITYFSHPIKKNNEDLRGYTNILGHSDTSAIVMPVEILTDTKISRYDDYTLASFYSKTIVKCLNSEHGVCYFWGGDLIKV